MGQQATLSATLEKKLQRLQVAADFLRKHGSRMKVAGILQKMWPKDCSRATAYRLIEEAQEVFAPQQMANREFYVDTLLGMSFSTREKALAKNDLKTMATIEKTILMIIVKFFGTSETLPIELIQPPTVSVGFYPELVNKPLPENYQQLLEQILKTRKVGIVADQDAELVPAEQPAASAADSTTPATSAEYE
jgi:hypothetical protein